jgi:hypothetical protein
VVPAIGSGEINAVGFVIGGDDDTAAIQNAVFPKVFSSTRNTSGGAAQYAFIWS